MNPEKADNTYNRTEREYPERPIASVAACVFRDKRTLLIKRATPPSKGLWSVPGGVIELGETLQDAARRELDEECGVDIEVDRVFNVDSAIYYDDKKRIHFHYVVTYLIAYYVAGEIRPGSNELDVRWATRRELDELDMNPIVRKNMSEAFDIVYPGD